MNRLHLVYLGIGIAVVALIVGVVNLGVTVADVTGILNLVGEK